MSTEFFEIGEALPNLNSDNLQHLSAKRVLSACLHEKANFEVLELRRISKPDGAVDDVIIVTCINDRVPSHNEYGIKTRERLALVFSATKLPETRAIRKDFPALVHMNEVVPGEPLSLCLYIEPPSWIERTWTPQKFLHRILWWLRESANGSLHRGDQPLERLYFDYNLQLVLPPDLEMKLKDATVAMTIEIVTPKEGPVRLIKALFKPKNETDYLKFFPMFLSLPPILHGNPERRPITLGELHDRFANRSAPFIDEVYKIVWNAAHDGIKSNPDGRCILVLQVPLSRSKESTAERTDTMAFLMPNDLSLLGTSLGAFTKHDGAFYPLSLIGAELKPSTEDWRNIRLDPVDVRFSPDRAMSRQMSGVDSNSADFGGVLAGVGSLGSTLADLWSKESWGNWTLIDPDFIEPHNVVRHIAKELHVGHYKVHTVEQMLRMNFYNGYYEVKAINKKVTDLHNNDFKSVITGAELFVDSTTTLEVPRDLSEIDEAPRCASVFVTPSGLSSVLLFESASRDLRLDSLEAQYYRAIINSEWGKAHLHGHRGEMWMGAGCRDLSMIIPYEVILLHAGILSRQLRLIRRDPEARICVWETDLETGAVIANVIPVYKSYVVEIKEWRVVMDEGVREKLRSMRNSILPNETGGIILGCVDHKVRKIYVVDILPATPDSESTTSGFVRGTHSLEENIKAVGYRTGNMIGYIGEWHSHPPFSSPTPSGLDTFLIRSVADIMSEDGEPAIMIIVGISGEISITIETPS